MNKQYHQHAASRDVQELQDILRHDIGLEDKVKVKVEGSLVLGRWASGEIKTTFFKRAQYSVVF